MCVCTIYYMFFTWLDNIIESVIFIYLSDKKEMDFTLKYLYFANKNNKKY